jgi:hypothetical protein
MKKCSCSNRGVLAADERAIGIGGTGGTRRPGVEGSDRLVTPGIYAIWMMLEALDKTVEAIEPTVCVEALASRLIVNSFSASVCSSWSSAHSSCSNCCLLGLIQNLHTKYVATAIAINPPITPPAIAPPLGPELEDFEGDTEAAALGSGTHVMCWQVSQVGGI